MTPPIFASVFAYAFGKAHHPHVDEAVQAELAKGTSSTVAGFRTLHRLRVLMNRQDIDVAFAYECSTLIGKARCLMSGKFLRTTSDLWVTIDDDVDADVAALSILVAAARFSTWHPHESQGATVKPAIIYGAMKTRAAWKMRYNVGFEGVDGNAGGEWTGRTGQLVPLSHGGAALMAIPRAALERMVAHFPELYFEEEAEPGSSVIDRNPALFKEELVDGDPLAVTRKRVWLGEDVMFSRRAEAAGVPRYGFIHPGIVHAGIPSV